MSRTTQVSGIRFVSHGSVSLHERWSGRIWSTSSSRELCPIPTSLVHKSVHVVAADAAPEPANLKAVLGHYQGSPSPCGPSAQADPQYELTTPAENNRVPSYRAHPLARPSWTFVKHWPDFN
jgi:hypothetical protein